jgi:hypothetical protein
MFVVLSTLSKGHSARQCWKEGPRRHPILKIYRGESFTFNLYNHLIEEENDANNDNSPNSQPRASFSFLNTTTNNTNKENSWFITPSSLFRIIKQNILDIYEPQSCRASSSST